MPDCPEETGEVQPQSFSARLHRALIAARENVGDPKGKNDRGKAYYKVDQIYNAVWTALTQYQILVVPEFVGCEHSDYKTNKGTLMDQAEIRVRFRFLDVVAGGTESVVTEWAGVASHNADMALIGAMTSAQRTFWSGFLMLEREVFPEGDSARARRRQGGSPNWPQTKKDPGPEPQPADTPPFGSERAQELLRFLEGSGLTIEWLRERLNGAGWGDLVKGDPETWPTGLARLIATLIRERPEASRTSHSPTVEHARAELRRDLTMYPSKEFAWAEDRENWRVDEFIAVAVQNGRSFKMRYGDDPDPTEEHIGTMIADLNENILDFRTGKVLNYK